MMKTWYRAADLAVLAAALALAPSGQARARGVADQSDAVKGIIVTGDGPASGTPDVARFTLGVQTEAQTAREAIDSNSASMTKVIDAVKRAGIPENKIRTSGLSLVPIMSKPQPGEGTPPQTVGYRANNTVTVTVEDVSKTGAVLDAGVGAGANTLHGVQFSIKDDTALRRQALEAAAQQARAKGEALAAALGLSITGIQTVEEGSGGPIPVATRSLAADASSANVPVQMGELTVQAHVRIIFNYS